MSSHHFHVIEHVVPGQHVREYPAGTNGNQDEVLEICVKQYTPLEWMDSEAPDGAVTIIGTHANGLPKELYEPLWDDILERSRGKFHIRGIWIADVMNQGNSYLKNETRLGNDPSWFDSSRDLLQIINHFQKEMPRPIVGIGSSFGAVQLVHLSLFHPRLFSSLILIDPVIVAANVGATVPGVRNPWGVIYLSAFRRDIWQSRDAARKSLSRNPFYQSWDSRVFEKLIEFGLVDVPSTLYPEFEDARVAATKASRRETDGTPDKNNSPAHPHYEAGTPVTLKTTKHQEVMTFVRPHFNVLDPDGNRIHRPRTHPDTAPDGDRDFPFYRPESNSVFRSLPFLRPPTFYVLGERSTISPPGERRHLISITGIGTGGNGGEARNRNGLVPGIAGLGTKGIALPRIGHLVAMEATGKTANLCVEWLENVMDRWAFDENEYKEDVRKKTKKEHLMLGEEWENAIKQCKPGEDWKAKL